MMCGFGYRGLGATVGMFDGVHLGHRLVIEQLHAESCSRGLCPVVFTFGEHPLALIAPERAPKMLSTMSQKARRIVRYGADGVNFLSFDSALRNLSAEEFMAMLSSRFGVRLLIVGYDHRFGRDRSQGFDDYQRIGARCAIEVVRADELSLPGCTAPVSSSLIRQCLSEGRINKANELLGYQFAISGMVVSGRHIGTSIGFPTANVEPMLSRQQLPAAGVYAGSAGVGGGERYPAMINIGVNPTVSTDGRQSIEAHLIGYSGNLYGQLIELGFAERLRDERRFASTEELAMQLHQDAAAVMSLASPSPHDLSSPPPHDLSSPSPHDLS